MWRRLASPAVIAAVVVALLPGLVSGQIINTDMGTTERTFSFFNLKPGTDQIIFAWIPIIQVSGAEQFLIGECARLNDQGEPVGNHNVTFKNLTLIGVDSGNAVEATKIKKKIKKGIQTRRAVWLLTPAARSLFSSDSSILVGGEVTVSKKVKSFDDVICGIGVTEILDLGGASKSAAVDERFEGPLVETDRQDLPRLLRTRGRRD